MHLWLIVPVKPLALGKSRLAPLLSHEERTALTRALLLQTLQIVSTVEHLKGLIAVSRDKNVLKLAQQYGATTLLETPAPVAAHIDPESTLNHALHQARALAVTQGADAILVLPADLPLLTVPDIEDLIQVAAQHERCVVLAGSDDGGTNALLMRPPHAIDFAYGPNSLQRHESCATAAGLSVYTVNSAALALDLDSPEDWMDWQALVG